MLLRRLLFGVPGAIVLISMVAALFRAVAAVALTAPTLKPWHKEAMWAALQDPAVSVRSRRLFGWQKQQHVGSVV